MRTRKVETRCNPELKGVVTRVLVQKVQTTRSGNPKRTGPSPAGLGVCLEFGLWILRSGSGLGFWRGVSLVDTVLLHAVNQRTPADIQKIGRSGLVPIESLQRFLD